jgi:aminoglycoside 2'-N-acetyltransferase I
VTQVERLRSEELTDRDRSSLRELFDEAWPDEGDRFTDEDWGHTFGGVHFVVREDGGIVSHASVVPRELRAGGVALATGYVEGVATRSERRRRGLGTDVMRAADEHIDAAYELGALGTGVHAFYERLGWKTWRGPTAVGSDDGDVPTPDEDGFVMVRFTPRTPAGLDLETTLSCDPRPGDAW